MWVLLLEIIHMFSEKLPFFQEASHAQRGTDFSGSYKYLQMRLVFPAFLKRRWPMAALRLDRAKDR